MIIRDLLPTLTLPDSFWESPEHIVIRKWNRRCNSSVPATVILMGVCCAVFGE